MLHYWITVIKILLFRKFRKKIRFDQTLERSYRVRILDCDGLRVMAAWKYTAYMDFIRWEMMARSNLLDIALNNKLAPALGSQKIIYRKPLKRGSRFSISLEFAGHDDKWVYHIHRFVQKGEIMALGVTRAILWKKGASYPMDTLIKELGSSQIGPPPPWIQKLFHEDKEIVIGHFDV